MNVGPTYAQDREDVLVTENTRGVVLATVPAPSDPDDSTFTYSLVPPVDPQVWRWCHSCLRASGRRGRFTSSRLWVCA